MRILVLTRAAWRTDNNIGNTLENIFSGMKSHSVYALALRSEPSSNSIAEKNFCISEQQFIRHILYKEDIGKFSKENDKIEDSEMEKNMYLRAKKKSFDLLWFAREFLWIISPWKNDNLREYMNEVAADIIFMPVFGCWYPHKILDYIRKHTNAKIILFHADDNYTMKQVNFSPLYWIYRLNLRRWVRKSVRNSEINYVISEIQKNEYEKIFKKDFKVLYKGYEFEKMPEIQDLNKPVKFVYTGNISSGRFKTLAMIGQVLKEINSKGKKAELDIYTLTPMNKKMQKMLDIPESVNIKGGVAAEQVKKIQKEADVLVHAESFGLKHRCSVRQSFSTKIVDYFSEAKCIFAAGPGDVASMDYLIKNDAAITATNKSEIEKEIKSVIENTDLIYEYARKAWECGKRNHQIDEIQMNLKNDFEVILNESCSD